jgi:uncharacterized repeat protein (TIGR03803 family)
VFSLTPPSTAGGAWSETVLYNFGGNDGANPYAGVVIGAGGVLYGTTEFGGTMGYGTVFSLTPPASRSGPWTEVVLRNFGAEGPIGGVVIGENGVLFGTTATNGTSGGGTVFALKPPTSPGGRWTEKVLHNFTLIDGDYPYAGVVIGSGQILFGTTEFGGSYNSGVVFSLTPPLSPGGTWTEAVLENFSGGGTGGSSPYSTVAIGSAGVLYGTTGSGGNASACVGGCGVVFALIPPKFPGGTWTETVLHRFSGTPTDGAAPYAGVAIGKNGVLYGTTTIGGNSSACSFSGCGTVFSLKP